VGNFLPTINFRGNSQVNMSYCSVTARWITGTDEVVSVYGSYSQVQIMESAQLGVFCFSLAVL